MTGHGQGQAPCGARPSLHNPPAGSAEDHARGAIALLAHFLHIILVGVDDLGLPLVPGIPAVLAVGRVAKVAAEFLFGLGDVGAIIIPILVVDPGDRRVPDGAPPATDGMMLTVSPAFSGV